MAPDIGQRIASGKEFDVFEYGTDDVVKMPRRRWLFDCLFGDFQRKTLEDLLFLQSHFAEFLPTTRLLQLGGEWAIRQQRISGTPFFAHPRMTPEARSLLRRATQVYRETGRIPDLLNPGNLVCEHSTHRLVLIDVSVLGGRRSWPPGFLASRFLGKVLFDSVTDWLASGFPARGRRALGREGA